MAGNEQQDAENYQNINKKWPSAAPSEPGEITSSNESSHNQGNRPITSPVTNSGRSFNFTDSSTFTSHAGSPEEVTDEQQDAKKYQNKDKKRPSTAPSIPGEMSGILLSTSTLKLFWEKFGMTFIDADYATCNIVALCKI